MKNLLYIGNKLAHKKANPSAINVLGPLLEKEGYRVFYASSQSNKLLRVLDMIWSCLKHYRQVDGVLIDTYSTQNFYYALVISQLCRLLQIPYIPILHGGNLEVRLKQSPKYSHLIFNDSKVNVAPSPFIKSVFESYGYANIVYIPNALDINGYPFKEKHIETIKLLWVRSFSNIYNPSLAVRVLQALCDSGYDTELCMVGPDSGDGSFQDTEQLAKELGVSVRFTGKLSKQEWIAIATDYNLFINTTTVDNMPVSVIEAMALGLPVVSTNVGGMPYLITHQKDGILVPPNQADAFASAIKQLVANPEKTEAMALNARKKVEQFDWNIVKYEWKKVLT